MRMRTLAGIVAVGLLLLQTSAVASPRTQITGNLVVSYYDILNKTSIPVPSSSHGQFSFDQVGLNIAHRFNERMDAQVSLVNSGASMTPTEAWIRADGLPFEGSITIGKFYKPLGASIPLANLSFPAIMFHVYSDYGLKLNFSRGIWSTELGLVNGAPISAPASQSGQVAGTQVVSNVLPVGFIDDDKNRDAYGRVEFSLGEDWGSLTAGITGTYGKLSTIQVGLLNPSGPPPGFSQVGQFSTRRNDYTRRHFEADIDFARGPWRLFGESYYAKDGRLKRTVWSAAASRTFYTGNGEVIATLGYDVLKINAERTIPDIPSSWDRRRISTALAWWPLETVQIIGEYDFNREDVYPRGGKRFGNDEFNLQSIIYF